MDEKWLHRICRKWQRRLGLMDWNPLTLHIVPMSELKPGSAANVSWQPDDMTSAEMWVSRLEDIEDDDPLWYTESSVIHELIHLLFYGHLEVPDYNVNDERAINKTALALFPRKRKAQ